jgi:hypothetical protein
VRARSHTDIHGLPGAEQEPAHGGQGTAGATQAQRPVEAATSSTVQPQRWGSDMAHPQLQQGGVNPQEMSEVASQARPPGEAGAHCSSGGAGFWGQSPAATALGSGPYENAPWVEDAAAAGAIRRSAASSAPAAPRGMLGVALGAARLKQQHTAGAQVPGTDAQQQKGHSSVVASQRAGAVATQEVQHSASDASRAAAGKVPIVDGTSGTHAVALSGEQRAASTAGNIRTCGGSSGSNSSVMPDSPTAPEAWRGAGTFAAASVGGAPGLPSSHGVSYAVGGRFPLSCSPQLPFAFTPSANSLASLHQVGGHARYASLVCCAS